MNSFTDEGMRLAAAMDPAKPLEQYADAVTALRSHLQAMEDRLAEAQFEKELAECAMRFVDRAGDICEDDTAEQICSQFHRAMFEVILKFLPIPHRPAAPQEGIGT